MVLIDFFEKAWTIVHGFDEQAWTIVHGFDQFFEKMRTIIVHCFHRFF